MTDAASISDRASRLAGLTRICGLLCVLGALIAWLAGRMEKASDPTIPQQSNFYHYTFTRFEPLSLFVEVIFFLGLSIFFLRPSRASPAGADFLRAKRLPLVVALGVLIVAGVGRFAVHQDFDLCIDEYLNEFEAKILAHHHLVAVMPQEWRGDVYAMTLGYLHYNAEKGYWVSGFLPGFASLDYLFDTVDLGWALSPLLAAASILLVARLAHRAFPEEAALAGGVAVLLLACSPQFLAMAMTKFAWTAHLCGSLLWVWLLTHPRRILFLLTPVLGAFLIGLHQPHVHFLIAVPFLIRLLRTRDWKAIAWFGLCYAVAVAGWYEIMMMLRAVSHATAGAPGVVAVPGDVRDFSFSFLLSFVVTVFNGTTLLAWATPALPLLVLVMVGTWKSQPPLIRDCFWAGALTFLFYLGFPHEQGHGWGFRYMQSAYGLLALAAAGGAVALSREGWEPAVVKAVVASAVFSVLIQIPYRAYEIRTMVRPLSLASRYIESRPADFVIVETSDFWYSWDLIRNDPWLQKRPLVFDGTRLSPAALDALKAKGTVFFVGAKEVKPFGVILSDPTKPRAPR